MQGKIILEQQQNGTKIPVLGLGIWTVGDLFLMSLDQQQLKKNLQSVALELSPDEGKHSTGWLRGDFAGLSGE
jgi:hypothetical protein